MSDGLPPDSAPIWAAITGVIGAGLGAVGLWLASRLMGKAAFQTAINAGFKELTDQLQEERQTYRKALDDERIAWAGERAQLRGEIINLTSTIEGLKRLLRRNGIDVPMGHGEPVEMIVIEGEQS